MGMGPRRDVQRDGTLRVLCRGMGPRGAVSRGGTPEVFAGGLHGELCLEHHHGSMGMMGRSRTGLNQPRAFRWKGKRRVFLRELGISFQGAFLAAALVGRRLKGLKPGRKWEMWGDAGGS